MDSRSILLTGVMLGSLPGCVSPPVDDNACKDLIATCASNPKSCDEGSVLASCGKATTLTFETDIWRLRKDIDVLFVIDNSSTMAAKQKAFLQKVPLFVQRLEESRMNYHIGIVTSDIGTNVQPGVPWGSSAGKCDTFEGDDGVLQHTPCSNRKGLSAQALSACAELCPDASFVPTDGRRFISRVDGVSNVPQALSKDPVTGASTNLGPLKALQCMAFVGDDGCGVTSPLEASKRAVDGHRAENSGFLRANSRLAVIYLADEDDCSVQMARRDQTNPAVRNCDPLMPDSYDCYNVEYRCFSGSVECNESLLTPGVKTGCKERANNYLEPLFKYSRFFGNLRPQSLLLIGGIWTLPSVSEGGQVEVVQSGGTASSDLSLASSAGAACRSSSNPMVTGQAQLRLSRFAKMFGTDPSGLPNVAEVSICSPDDYPKAMDGIVRAIAPNLELSCLSNPPAVDASGKPLCLVGEVDIAHSDNVPTAEETIPLCTAEFCDSWASTTIPIRNDEMIRNACATETHDCYCAVRSRLADVCPGSVVAGVWHRGNAPAPIGKVVSYRCASTLRW